MKIETPVKAETTIKAETARKHHRCSPSSLQAREACPCYDGAEPAVQHARTIEGNEQHAAVEQREDNNQLSDERMEHAASCASATDAILAEFKRKHKTIEIFKECEVSVCDWEDVTAGFLDSAAVGPAEKPVEGVLIDYKFGEWEVEPVENNLQIWAYVCGLWSQFKSIGPVHAYILQPAHDSIDQFTFTRDRYDEMLLRIKRVRVRYESPVKKPLASIPACLFCKHLAGCPEAERVVRAVSAKYPPLQALTDVMRFNPTTISSNLPSDNAVIMDVSTLMAAWAKAARTAVTEHAIHTGQIPPSFTLVSQDRRSVVSVTAVEATALKFGVPLDVIESAKTISITPLADDISERAERGTKEARKEEFSADLTLAGAYGDAYPVVMLQKQRKRKAQKDPNKTASE